MVNITEKIILVLVALLQLFVTCHADHSSTNPFHDCFRPCDWPTEPMVCNYHFRVEWFSSMSTFCGDCPLNSTNCDNLNCIPLNGVQRPVLTVNRQFPGPSIQVCEGDTINVTVQNMLDTHEELTIHWHGIHQVHTPFMDGAPKITQCPILFGSSFVYTFNATEVGTHYWHAHSGHQRADGCAGPLIVRQAPERDVHYHSYQIDDESHVIMLQDWFDQPTLITFIGHHLAGLSGSPDSILVNGHGRRVSFETHDNNVDPPAYTARQTVQIRSGMTHRFRVISNGITNCPFQVSVDNHTISVIATDGSPVRARIVDAFVIFAGERFDFLLEADRNVGNYWLRVRGLGDCASYQELAVVRYHGADESHDPLLPGHYQVAGSILNPYNALDMSAGNIYHPLHMLESLKEDKEGVLGQTVTTYYLPMDLNSVSKFGDSNQGHMDDMPTHHDEGDGHTHSKRAHEPHGHGHEDSGNGHENATGSGHEGHHNHGEITAQINHASFLVPTANLLTQAGDIYPSTLCNVKDIDAKCETTYCECTQVLYAELGEIIELVLVDEGFGSDQSHPMHIHGHAFRVVAQEKKGDELSIDHVIDMDRNGGIARNLDSPPLKDTVAVPDGGYTIIRFNASNPGWWLFHCHIQFHLSNGMSLVIRVGEESDQPPTPNQFPTCNDWRPGMSSAASRLAPIVNYLQCLAMLAMCICYSFKFLK